MNYAIDLLRKERIILELCLSDWEAEQYPEAKKEREKRLSDINEALELIEQPVFIPFKKKYEPAKCW